MIKLPLRRYRIEGKSMEPRFHTGDRVLVSTWSRIRKQDVVVCRAEAQIMIKKVHHIEDKRFFLTGENQAASTDSHDFGAIERDAIIGKVFLKY